MSWLVSSSVNGKEHKWSSDFQGYSRWQHLWVQWHFQRWLYLWCAGMQQQGNAYRACIINWTQRHSAGQPGCIHCSCTPSYKSCQSVHDMPHMHRQDQFTYFLMIHPDNKHMRIDCTIMLWDLIRACLYVWCFCSGMHNVALHSWWNFEARFFWRWGRRQSWPSFPISLQIFAWHVPYFCQDLSKKDPNASHYSTQKH